MDLTTLKILLLLVMIVGVIIAGLLPVRVLKMLRQNAARASTSQKHKNISLILCCLTCISGGVFLGTCFLHLSPELAENIKKLETTANMHFHYPIAELLSCLGFFLLFFLEELVMMLIPSMAHGHSHGHHTHEGGHVHDDHDHGIMEKKTALDTGDCCMSNLPQVKMMEEQSAGDGANQSMLPKSSPPLEDVDGHCQKHCPLTVHDRRQSGGGQDECTNGNAQLITTVILAEPERCETNCDKDEDPPILMKSSPHAHSHGVRSITLVLALSFHELIEGVAFGVQGDVSKVSALFLSLLIHKVIVAFSTGLQLARTHAHQMNWVVASIVCIALTSPLGAAFGMAISSGEESATKDWLIAIFQGLAVGTFLYVTFFEILLHERDNEHNNMVKLFFMLLGFGVIALLRLLDGGHDHDHGKTSNGTMDSSSLLNATARALHIHDHDHEH